MKKKKLLFLLLILTIVIGVSLYYFVPKYKCRIVTQKILTGKMVPTEEEEVRNYYLDHCPGIPW